MVKKFEDKTKKELYKPQTSENIDRLSAETERSVGRLTRTFPTEQLEGFTQRLQLDSHRIQIIQTLKYRNGSAKQC